MEKKKKILLIDDDRGIVGVMQKALEQKGFDVLAAYDGKEGFEVMKAENPDLIVLDIRMPSMNGYEFMRALRTEQTVEGKAMTPVIMLTAKEEMEDVFKLEGAKGYMVKPVEPDQLIKKIEEVL